jgi:hypothetical protein
LYLNLWVGPTATPQAGDWQPISDFLLDIICNGDGNAHQYLIRFLAHALQHPADKPGVVIVMLGGQLFHSALHDEGLAPATITSSS